MLCVSARAPLRGVWKRVVRSIICKVVETKGDVDGESGWRSGKEGEFENKAKTTTACLNRF